MDTHQHLALKRTSNSKCQDGLCGQTSHEELLLAAKGYSYTRHAWLNSPISCIMLMKWHGHVIRSCFCMYEEDLTEQIGFQWVQCVCKRWIHKDCYKQVLT